MAETGKPKIKRYSSLALADLANDEFISIARSALPLANRANDKFLSIARSPGKAARFIQSCTMGGYEKIKHALSREKKEKKSKQPDRTKEIKESALTDEWPEEDGSSPSEVKTESDVD